MSGLFISYRRQDAAAYAGRFRSDLARRYGEERVFLDVADLAPGTDWTTRLHQAVASCDWMLVVIGPQWLSATDPGGRRRIDDPEDFIRSEIAAALRLGKRAVPVLVGGASMPSMSELPSDVSDMVDFQAVELRDESWDYDLSQLFRVLDPLMGVDRTAPSVAMPSPAARAPQERAPARAVLPFMVRLAQAFDVLLGRGAREAAAPGPTPAPPATPSPTPPNRAVSTASSQTAQPLTPPRHDVFVSYSTEDCAFVDEMVRALELLGRRCWIAHRDIPPGVPSWAEPIVTAIASSRLVLVLLTAHSIPSVEVMREVTLAADEKIPLLPVSLDATPLSPGLRYFFVAGQRLDLARSTPAEQVRSILPAVDRQLPASA